MKNIKILFLLLFVSVFGFAQNSSRIFKNAEFLKDNQFKVEVSDGVYFINFYNTKIVETSFIPKGEAKSNTSHAVVLNPDKTHISIKKNRK